MTDAQTVTAQSRPRNSATTRDAILDAARVRFTRDPYDQVSVRQISADAGIDAALICRYFGSKEKLFGEVVATAGGDPMEVLAGDRADFGMRVARAMLERDDAAKQETVDFINLTVRATMSPTTRELVRQDIERRFIHPFAEWLGGPDAITKAWTTASVLMGVAVLRNVVSGPEIPIPNEEMDTAVTELAAVLQTIVDGNAEAVS